MCGSLVQQTLFPFIHECFLSCLIVNDSVRLEKKIFVKLFSSLCFHLLEKAGALHLKKKEKTMIPFTKECFVPCFVEIDPEIMYKMSKFLQCIFAISLSSLLGKEHGPSLKQI